MRAVVLRSHGGPEALTIEEVDDPMPGLGEIVVDVEHTALNRADVLQRMGLYPDPRGRAIEIRGSSTPASCPPSALTCPDGRSVTA